MPVPQASNRDRVYKVSISKLISSRGPCVHAQISSEKEKITGKMRNFMQTT